jgi:hypothetical protein
VHDENERFFLFFGRRFDATSWTSPSSRLCLSPIVAAISAMALLACSKASALDTICSQVEEYSFNPVLRNSCCHSGARMFMNADFISSSGRRPV